MIFDDRDASACDPRTIAAQGSLGDTDRATTPQSFGSVVRIRYGGGITTSPIVRKLRASVTYARTFFELKQFHVVRV